MLRALSFLLVPLCWQIEPAVAKPSVPHTNCTGWQQRLDLDPVGDGPMALVEVYCQALTSTPFPQSDPLVSADGKSIAYYDSGSILQVAPLGGTAWTSYPADLGVFARFGSEIRSVPAFAWSSVWQFIWAATHERDRPHGFSTTPMQPVQTDANGTLKSLPPLTSDAGPLDALLWAGGDGLAVAQFGTRGGFYRPEHADPNPAFAIVDAGRGLVLDSLPFESITALKKDARRGDPWAHVTNAAATTLSDGRVRVLLSVGDWVVWTQGETVRTLPDPYKGERFHRMILSPDGTRILVSRLLRPIGPTCEWGLTQGACPPLRPVEGVLAALHDVDTGRELWALRATVTLPLEFPTPAISPNGRYALVGLVPTGDRAQIVLVELRNGHIVETIPAPGHISGRHYAMGFIRDGRTVWSSANGITALYDIRDGAGDANK